MVIREGVIREGDAAVSAPALQEASLMPALLTRVSWGAIFAGAIVAVALTVLIGFLGLGIGFGNLDLNQGDAVNGAPKATLIWWAVTSIVATGIGGFVAARLAGIPRGVTGALHGLAVWAVATLATLWLATTAVGVVLGVATTVVNTTTKVATTAIGTTGKLVVGAGGAVIPSPSQNDANSAKARVQSEAAGVLKSAGVGQSNLNQAEGAVGTAARNIAIQPSTADQEINRLIDRLFQGPNAALSPAEQQRLIDVIAQRAGVSRAQAQRIAQNWQSQANMAYSNVQTTGGNVLNQAGNTAVNVGNGAADVLSKIAWGMFWISLAGLVAAVLGAAIGGATLGLGVLAGRAADVGYGRDHVSEDNRDYVRERE